MLRTLAGSALLFSALGAAALVGSSLTLVPRGEPMLVKGEAPAGLHEVRFEEAHCPLPLVLDDRIAARTAMLIALRFRVGRDGALSTKAAGPDEELRGDEVLVALDAAGRVLATGSAEALAGETLAGYLPGSCGEPAESRPGLI